MVNPNSDIYRKHPDWVLNFPGRPRSQGCNQLVLNLARPDVHDYMLGVLDKLLTENEIAFLKWDCNRNGASRAGINCLQRSRRKSTSSSRAACTAFWRR